MDEELVEKDNSRDDAEQQNMSWKHEDLQNSLSKAKDIDTGINEEGNIDVASPKNVLVNIENNDMQKPDENRENRTENSLDVVGTSITSMQSTLMEINVVDEQDRIKTNEVNIRLESNTEYINTTCNSTEIINNNLEQPNKLNEDLSQAESINQENNNETRSINTENNEIVDIEVNDYDLTKNYFHNKIVELSRLSTDSSINKQNYFRGCKWSPDGTCILSVVNNGGMQVTELSKDLYSNENVSTERAVDILNPALCIKEAGLVYDFQWYPKMNSYDPVTCCWLTSIQHGPVQLWDAFDGSLRSSYRGYNDVDEVEAALCIHFSPNGDNIFAGYKKSIKLFDTDRPGRDYLNFRIKQPASCMTLNRAGNLLAIGSWRRTIALMSVNSGDLIQYDTIYGHKGGITNLMFMDDPSTNSTTYLLSGARMDPTLFLWDIRQTTKPVRTFCRQVMSNQRIYFDLSPYYNTWLISASTSGLLRVWNLKEDKELKFPVHNDCCNGVSFHPSRPIIATSSGQHHFSTQDNLNSDDSENIANNLIHTDETNQIIENSLVFWWIGDITNCE